jgi:hypothetical protein
MEESSILEKQWCVMEDLATMQEQNSKVFNLEYWHL